MDDRQLIERLRQGDRAAFDTIFRTHYESLVRIAAATLREVEAAEEVVQDVMLELWRRRESLPLEDAIRPYLIRSARNRALNHVRHRVVARKAEPFVQGPTSVEAVGTKEIDATELEDAVRMAIAELPPRCRDVFELSRVNGLKYAEIARTLEISVKTVEAQMGKALRILRERLEPWLRPG